MKFLIIKTSSFGDIVHTFPVLSYLRKKFPLSQIDWVVERRCAALVKAHPQVDRVIEIDSKAWRQVPFRKILREETYSVAFDLQGNCKSGLVLFNARADRKVGFGRKTVAEWPNLFATRQRIDPPLGQNIREDYLYLVQSALEEPFAYEETPVVLTLLPDEQERLLQIPFAATLVCPGAAWKSKRVPEETLLAALKKLETPHFLFGWGTEEEKTCAKRLAAHFGERGEVLEKLSLPLLQNVMARVERVVAMDSLPLHLAATTSTPTLSFFGPSSAKKYRPLGEQHEAFVGACPYNITFEKRCPRLRTCDAPCLKAIDLDRGAIQQDQSPVAPS